MRVTFAIALIVAVGGCSSGPSKSDLLDQISDLESQNAELAEANAKLQATLETASNEAEEAANAADETQAAVQAISSEIDGFSYYDWSIVVRDLEGAVTNAQTSADQAAVEASEAREALSD